MSLEAYVFENEVYEQVLNFCPKLANVLVL